MHKRFLTSLAIFTIQSGKKNSMKLGVSKGFYDMCKTRISKFHVFLLQRGDADISDRIARD